MTDEARISMTARLSGKDATADVEALSDYLLIAGQEIMERCYPFGYKDDATIPKRYELLQCKIAAYLINKEGAEGQTSHSENGVSRSYESGGVPESMLNQITPMGMVF